MHEGGIEVLFFSGYDTFKYQIQGCSEYSAAEASSNLAKLLSLI